MDIGMSIEKHLDAISMAVGRCRVKRRGVGVFDSMDIGLSIEKKRDAMIMALA